MARVFVPCALLTTGLLIAAASIARDGPPASATAVVLGLAFVPYAGLLLGRPPRSGTHALTLALALAALAAFKLFGSKLRGSVGKAGQTLEQGVDDGVNETDDGLGGAGSGTGGSGTSGSGATQ